MAASSQHLTTVLEISYPEWFKKLQCDMSDFEYAIQNTDVNSEKYIKLLKGLKYWNKTMQPVYAPNRFIFTLYNEHVEKRLDVPGIIIEIVRLVGKEAIKSIYFPRNAKYLGVDFVSEEKRREAQELFKMFKSCYVVPSEIGGMCQLINIRVHWYPDNGEFIKIKIALNPYVEIKKIENDNYKVNEELNFASSLITIKAHLKPGIQIQNIPHIMNIGGVSALITIRGREPMCLSCRQVGHKSMECMYKRCKRCHDLYTGTHSDCLDVNKKHLYSKVVKKNNKENQSEEFHNEGMEYYEDGNTYDLKENTAQDLYKAKQIEEDQKRKEGIDPDPNFTSWQNAADAALQSSDLTNAEEMDESDQDPAIVTREEYEKSLPEQLRVLRRSKRNKANVYVDKGNNAKEEERNNKVRIVEVNNVEKDVNKEPECENVEKTM